MEQLWQDLRHGLRVLVKRRGFTLVAVSILAVGIGANTAIFSVVNGVLLRPLPYTQPDQLLMVWGGFPTGGLNKTGLSQKEFVTLRAESRTFKQVAAYTNRVVSLTGVGEPERVPIALVSANLFHTLGVAVFNGRGFDVAEEEQGRNNVAILSYGFWQRRFGADPDVLGRSLTLNGQNVSVIGVLPQQFQPPSELMGGLQADVWLTLGLNSAQLNLGSHGLNTIARLSDGATVAQAQVEVSSVIDRVVKENPSFYPDDGSYHNFVTDMREEVVGSARLGLVMLLCSVALVLLIACANVANLMLARGEARRREMAIRSALGASRGRIVRQLLAESFLLAVIGGGVGVLLAIWGLEALMRLNPGNIPRLGEVQLDLRVLLFTVSVSMLTGLLFGLAPAMEAARTDVHTGLKEGARVAGSATRTRLRNALVVSEMALALLLLVGAGLLIKSFWRLRQVDPGIEAGGLLMMSLSPPASAYQNNAQVASLYERVVTQVRTLPGIESVAATNPLPLSGANRDTIMQIEDRPFDLSGTNLSTDFSTVTPGFFEALGVRLIKGRLLDVSDREGKLPVAVINEKLARVQWPNQDPVGKRIRLLDAPPDRATTRYMTVVGVVADIKNQGLAAEPRQEVFVPLDQQVSTGAPVLGMALVVRSDVETSSLVNLIRERVWSLDRNIVISNVQTMEQLMAGAIVQQRFNAVLLGVFATVALCLGVAGIYGVISYWVSRRTQEIGIRMAVGASSGDVLRMVLRQGALLIVFGIAAGIFASAVVTRLMTGLLFDVSATDPLTFGGVTLVLAAVALLACCIPAIRATRVDPIIALRYE